MGRGDAITAITATEARSAAERVRDSGADDREVMLAAFKAARGGFMAPEENEAFLAGIAAICETLPERKEIVMAEARAINDRSKMLNALMNGVPVDLEAFDPAPVPDDAVGLLALFRETDA